MNEKEERCNLEIPIEFVALTRALANEIRLQILLLLIENEDLMEEEIIKIFKDNANKDLDHDGFHKNMNKLELGGVVQNFLQKRENGFSHYKITPFGKKMLLGLIDLYNDYYSNIKSSF